METAFDPTADPPHRHSDGTLLGMIRLPEIPANCPWGDSDYRTMYFTAPSSVYRMPMKTTGMNPWRGG